MFVHMLVKLYRSIFGLFKPSFFTQIYLGNRDDICRKLGFSKFYVEIFLCEVYISIHNY